jgi:hypothetical protein
MRFLYLDLVVPPGGRLRLEVTVGNGHDVFVRKSPTRKIRVENMYEMRAFDSATDLLAETGPYVRTPTE